MKSLHIALFVFGKRIIWHPIFRKVEKEIVFIRVADVDGGGSDKFLFHIAY